jgi:hypothetical protein
MDRRSSNHSSRGTASVVGLVIMLTALAMGGVLFVAACGKTAPAAAKTAASKSATLSGSAGPPQSATPSDGGSSDSAPSLVPNSTSPSPHPIRSRANSASHPEQEWHTGANTFSDPRNASGMGPKIAPAQYVLVSCKLYDPSIASADPGGYWYRIASSPWDNQYYAVANTFLNGDPWSGPYTHPTDLSVPDCRGAKFFQTQPGQRSKNVPIRH